MKKLALLIVLSLALSGGALTKPASAPAGPGPCGLPGFVPNWIDFADGSVPFWQTFARPGVIAAASNFIFPPQLRAAGATTVYWDMYLNNRVGQPSKPADPADVVARANKLFDYAARSSDCSTPLIAENELFGAGLATPWSPTNKQYRANVLLYLQTLASNGARPFLLVNSTPYTGGDAADWWREVAKVADIVREDYFPAPAIYRQGPVVGNRTLRVAMRNSITDFTSIGIPVSKLGIMLGFQTEPGSGGRERLERQAWYDVVKRNALAARQVAAELRFATIWSWGWANWGERGLDPDKEGAACVYLWTRAHSLCNGPAAAGPGFNASLTEGQLQLPRDVQCSVAGRRIGVPAIRELQTLTVDRELAYTALYARLVESRQAPVSTREVLAAEAVIVSTRFRGSRAAYLGELAKVGVPVPVARGIIGDEIRHARIAATLPASPPSSAEVSMFYDSYPDVLARRVSATPAPPWLGGRKQGLALSSLAPPDVFGQRTGTKASVSTMTGRYTVKALGDAVPLGSLPLEQARGAIVAALETFSRGEALERWTVTRQGAALREAYCQRDDLPQPGAVELSTYLPFLALNDPA